MLSKYFKTITLKDHQTINLVRGLTPLSCFYCKSLKYLLLYYLLLTSPTHHHHPFLNSSCSWLIWHFSFQFKIIWGLPWWRSGWESACQCRGHGFEPWSGKIPHAAERLGLWATTTEPARLEPVLRNKRGRDSERSAHRDEEWPPLASTGESPRTETKTQHSHK